MESGLRSSDVVWVATFHCVEKWQTSFALATVQETIVALISDEGGATRPLSTLSREGGLSFLAKLDSFAFHQQFQASSGPTLFTYSTPKFCWSRKKWHRSPTFGCTLLCKWHASSPFWNPTRQTAWEIPKGGRPVIYITGLNLGPVVATPAMDAVFGVLGALRLLWKSNGLRCVGTSPRSSQNLPEDMLRGRFWKEMGPVTTSPNSLFACWSQPQPRMLSCWIPGGVSTCCRSLQGSGFWNATVCFYRI